MPTTRPPVDEQESRPGKRQYTDYWSDRLLPGEKAAFGRKASNAPLDLASPEMPMGEHVRLDCGKGKVFRQSIRSHAVEQAGGGLHRFLRIGNSG